jgi:2-isopropylmalate synthase
MEHEFGYRLPKAMHPEFGSMIKQKSDTLGKELSPDEIMQTFKENYLEIKAPFVLLDYSVQSDSNTVKVNATIQSENGTKNISGSGNGPISAFFDALNATRLAKYRFEAYEGHALSSGADAEAVAYIQLANGGGKSIFGVGKDRNTTTASFQAIMCALNRVIK